MTARGTNTKIVNIVPPGMTPVEADFGAPYIQNMQTARSGWEVRSGFGVICQYDSKLSTGKYSGSLVTYGLEKHLGSYLIRNTSFGHKQVVSIWRANVIPASMAEGSHDDKLIQRRKLYVVHINDLTTGEHWEEILHHHTSEDKSFLFRRHGNFETCASDREFLCDRQSWVDAGQNESEFNITDFNTDRNEYFYFSEVQGQDRSVRLFFGSERSGAWFYSPCDFRSSEYDFRERWQQANVDMTQDWRSPYSESPVIQPVSMAAGSFYDEGKGLTYLTSDEFGKPQACCTLGSRMVWAVSNLLFFSDPEVPNAVIVDNAQPFPAKIVAVAPTMGNLIVWTEDKKTYYYYPADGSDQSLISGGRNIEISANVGILNTNAWVSVDGGIVWIDTTGIYKVYGNITVSKMSEQIDPFFNESGISNLLTNYYTQNGNSDIVANTQPSTFYNFSPDAEVGVNVSFQPTKQQILFNIPYLNISLIYETGMWHVWNYESIVYGAIPRGEAYAVPIVRGVHELPNNWLMTDIDDVYMTAGRVEQTWEDTTLDGGTDVRPERFSSMRESSGLLLRLGRGGGLDRTLGLNCEDKRRAVGEYVSIDGDYEVDVATDVRDDGYFYFDKLRTIKNNTTFSWTASAVAGIPATKVSDADKSPIWLPIKFVPRSDKISFANNVTLIGMRFTFDNTHWKPYINNSNTNTKEVVFNLPPERLGAKSAYFIGTADHATANGVFVTNAAGVPDENGNTIWVFVDPTASGGTWPNYPELNMCSRFKNDIIDIAFKRKSGVPAVSDDVWDMGIKPVYTLAIYTATGAPLYSQSRVWRDHTHADNATYQNDEFSYQAVDWCMQSAPIEGNEDSVVKLRGVDAVVQSSGIGTPNSHIPKQQWQVWPIRIFNVLFSTNFKQFAAQLYDFQQADPKAISKFMKTTLRERLVDNEVTYTPTFAGQAKWGDSNDNDAGNFLIGDGPQDRIRGSGDVKGEGVSVMMFGHIMNTAERIKIASAKAIVRVIGSLRREGRP